MEEACSNDSFDLSPPEAPERQEEAEVSRDTVPEQAGTVSTTLPAEKSEGPSSTITLPNLPVLSLDDQEMQEHRDAILQQQMLGRQLLSERTRRHNSRHHLTQE